jgi:lysozyme
MLVEEEGMRLRVYNDTEGIPTIGVGRNLRDKGISREEALKMLADDIDDVLRVLETLPWWSMLDEVRQRVLADMAFNLGVSGLLQFEKMIAHIRRRAWDDAAEEMLRSKWSGQVGRRAHRLAQMMETGVDQPL